jgi:hypothetical protein
MNTINNHFVVCSCQSAEHTLRFICDPEEQTIYTEVQLSQTKSLRKRIVIAVRYIFGRSTRYGVWDCTLMEKDEALKLSQFIDSNLRPLQAISEY